MIDIRNLCVDAGRFSLHNISLKIETGEYFMILGPTGAGKTVLLESIAGIYHCKSGEIWLGGRNITRLEPDSRGVSIVYQDHALFPHLSVKENIVFGLRMRKAKPAEMKSRLENVAGLLELGPLLVRRPDTLSGGEKQKAALARAIVTGPGVLLLDEPLGALDPETRENVQQELQRLHAELHITVLHVTHDFEEAMTMGKRLGVIGAGGLKQVGTNEEIFRRPNSEFVARFVMARNIFEGMATRNDSGTTVFRTGDIALTSQSDPKGECHASIRPEEILVTLTPVTGENWNCLPATITRIVNRGSTLHVTASLPPDLDCLITHHSFREMGLYIGRRVYVGIPASSVNLF